MLQIHSMIATSMVTLVVTDALTPWLVDSNCKILLTARPQVNENNSDEENKTIILLIEKLGMDWLLPSYTFPKTWRRQISKFHECLWLWIISFLPDTCLQFCGVQAALLYLCLSVMDQVLAVGLKIRGMGWLVLLWVQQAVVIFWCVWQCTFQMAQGTSHAKTLNHCFDFFFFISSWKHWISYTIIN